MTVSIGMGFGPVRVSKRIGGGSKGRSHEMSPAASRRVGKLVFTPVRLPIVVFVALFKVLALSVKFLAPYVAIASMWFIFHAVVVIKLPFDHKNVPAKFERARSLSQKVAKKLL